MELQQCRQFSTWRQNFIERSNSRLITFRDDLRSQINVAVEDFVNRNYSNENAGKDWQKVVERMDLPQKCKNFLENLAEECERKRKDLSDQLTQEINTTSLIQMDGTTPWGKIAFQVATNALIFVPL